MTYPHNDRDRQAQGNRNADPRDPRNQEEEKLRDEGDYPVLAIAYKWGYAGGEKHEQIGVRIRITEGADKGQSMLWYGGFHPNSEEFTIKALKAMGIWDKIWDAPSGQIEGASPAIAVVKHEQYQGKTRAKVQWINGADVVMKDEMNPNDLAKFAHRMRGNIQRHGGGGGGQQQQRGGVPPRNQQQQPQTQRSFGDQRSNGNGRGYTQEPDDDRPPFDDNDAPPQRGYRG